MFKSVMIAGVIVGGCMLFGAKSEQVVDVLHEQKVSQKLDHYLSALTSLNRFSGSVVVAKGDTVLLNKGYGFANHEFDVPNTPDTLFRICSITKMFTAVAILQLQEKGLLSVTDSLDKYMSHLSWGKDVTIHHILSHTSGIDSTMPPEALIMHPVSLDQFLDYYKDSTLEFLPGSDYRYCNVGYFFLSSIIEKVSGTSYEIYIQKNILDPLEMHSSMFNGYDYAILKKAASGYCLDGMNRLIHGHNMYGHFFGSGGLLSTAYDLYLFARALNNNALLTEASRKAMSTPCHATSQYGYGCFEGEILGRDTIGHHGMMAAGFKTDLRIFVNEDLYIIILNNLFSASVPEARDVIAAIMFDERYEMPS